MSISIDLLDKGLVEIINGNFGTLRGIIKINLQNELKESCKLRLKIRGTVKINLSIAQWNSFTSEFIVSGTTPSIDHHFTNVEAVLWEKPNNLVLEKGLHSFPFSIDLPLTIPPSLDLTHANVSYVVRASFTRKGLAKDIKAHQKFQVANCAPRGALLTDIKANDSLARFSLVMKAFPPESFLEDGNLKVHIHLKVLQPDVVAFVKSIRIYVQEIQTFTLFKNGKPPARYQQTFILGKPVNWSCDKDAEEAGNVVDEFKLQSNSSASTATRNDQLTTPGRKENRVSFTNNDPRFFLHSINHLFNPNVQFDIPFTLSLSGGNCDITNFAEISIVHKLKIHIFSRNVRKTEENETIFEMPLKIVNGAKQLVKRETKDEEWNLQNETYTLD